MTDTMLAAVWERANEPSGSRRSGCLRRARGEALVWVSSCGMCYTDLHVLRGEVAFTALAPLPDGLDVAPSELTTSAPCARSAPIRGRRCGPGRPIA